MMWTLFLACDILLVLVTTGQGVDYCQIRCPTGYEGVTTEHTMCKYPTSAPGQKCGSPVSTAPLTQEGKSDILRVHNDLRSQVGMGEFSGQPVASNMNKLYWDTELEAIAQRWADQCNFIKHDKCRNTQNDTVGQNTLVEGSGSQTFVEKTYDLSTWTNEVEYVTSEIISKYQPSASGTEIGHYVQMVWADTERIGCARSVSSFWDEGRQWLGDLVVCNYAPAGLWRGQPVYKQGSPCSECSSGKSSAQYSGLCADTSDPDAGNHSLDILADGEEGALFI